MFRVQAVFIRGIDPCPFEILAPLGESGFVERLVRFHGFKDGIAEQLPAGFVVGSNQSGPCAVGIIVKALIAVAPGGEDIAGISFVIVALGSGPGCAVPGDGCFVPKDTVRCTTSIW